MFEWLIAILFAFTLGHSDGLVMYRLDLAVAEEYFAQCETHGVLITIKQYAPAYRKEFFCIYSRDYKGEIGA